MLSSDGSIRGFQPTSRVAVNHWAANPLAKELYGGKNLSPGEYFIDVVGILTDKKKKNNKRIN